MTERLNEQREEQARSELGATEVPGGVARALVAAFLLTIALVPTAEWLAGAPPWSRLVAERPTACSLETFERALEDASAVGRAVRPPWQRVALTWLGLGNEQVYPGRDGWLFHRPGFDYVTGPGFLEPEIQSARTLGADGCDGIPHPDPVATLEDFAGQLRARGVALIAVPTPVKAVVAPDRFVAGVAGPLQNASWPAFLAALASAGVDVFDPTPLLAPDDFLPTDTHWRPDAVARVAAALAGRIAEAAELAPPDPGAFSRGHASAVNEGDLTAMLDLPEGQSLLPPERVDLAPVREARETRSSGSAEVLLLGDSFSNIYSSRDAFARTAAGGEALDWGADAGLADQLAFALGRPVDRIVRNAGGAHATRVALAAEVGREAAAGRDRLAGVRVVVYQFAMRELAVGDWKPVTLAAAPPEIASAREAARSETAAPSSAGARRVTGTLVARGPLPRPGTVPYPDALVALHLTAVEGADGADELVVYVWGMRDHAWTDAARWPVGERLTLDVQPWDDDEIQRRLATTSRGELEDLDLLVLPTYFGEPRR